MTADALTEGHAQGSLIEGVVRTFQPDAALRAVLLAEGVDVNAIARRYPSSVWRQVQHRLREHVFPEVPAADGYRMLGRRIIDGFLGTVVGSLLGAALPFISPVSFLNRTPSYMRLGRDDVTVEVDLLEPGRYRVTIGDPCTSSGEVAAGILERCLERMGVVPTVLCRQTSDSVSTLDVRWEKAPKARRG